MQVLDLTGDWRVKRTETQQEIPAVVPGNVHLDLLRNHKIPDPFYRDNEERLFWIGEKDWIYTRQFTVNAGFLKSNNVILQCDGLDTIADVHVNGHKVGACDNMFRTWEWDVKGFLHEGENTIKVYFYSVFPEIEKRQRHNYCRSSGGSIRFDGNPQIRKEPCNFGWDWGIKAVTCGIWRPLRILSFDTARIQDFSVRQQHSRNRVTLNVSIDTQTVDNASQTVADVGVYFRGGKVTSRQIPITNGRGDGEIQINSPHLWWPNNMGDQNLYDVTVTLKTEDNKNLLDERTKRVGLRTLELVQDEDNWGHAFTFRVNGVPFFAKGGNWIPADAFQGRVTPEGYRWRLESCRDANMNMLRVWGGGVYEEDTFYDLCDELGLLVWQDFMFACAAYPANNKEFMENVQVEAEQNVQRLHHHPCIALYCGNNELEQLGHVKEGGGNGAMTWESYKALFDKLLPDVVQRYHPEAPYIPSSEYSPKGDRTDTNADWCGDAHLWQVWHGYKPFEWYRTAMHRFCSEFGFQAVPEPKTVHTFTNKDDRNLNSYIMNKHQRSGAGNQKLIHYMLDWYRLPTSFENSVWLSQIQQGLAIKYAVEHWRRNMPRCMGALYWQINDCWPVVSWSSIDYFGRWKALHYIAKRFFAPILVSAVEDAETGKAEVYVSNDCTKPVEGNLVWRVTNAQGKELDGGEKKTYTAKNKSERLTVLRVKKWLDHYSARDIMLWLDFQVDGASVSRNFVTFDRPRNFSLQPPYIRADVTKKSKRKFELTLTAQHPALWAWIELENTDITCSDNFFCMEPEKPHTVSVYPTEDMNKNTFQRQLLVRSIFDTYQ